MEYTDRELYKKCVELSFMIKKYRDQFIALLPEVNSRQLYLQHGMHDIFEFASKLAGLNHDIVRRILNLEVNLKDKPVLNEMFKSGQVGWSKLEVVSKIATPENEEQLSKKLPTMSKASLTMLVKDSQSKSQVFAGEGLPGISSLESQSDSPVEPPLESFTMKLDVETSSQLRVLKLKLERKLKRPLTWNEVMNEMTAITTEKIEPKPRESKTETKSTKISRHIPIAQRREALAKTKHLCSFPDCKKPAEELHHEDPFVESHSHDSIRPLCKPHHDIEHHKGDSYINRKYQEHKRQAIMNVEAKQTKLFP